jgi:hypothetical protein
MLESNEQQSPALPRQHGRAARIAWRTGWVLLALVSMAVTYAVLVYIGR